ncbi:MAG: translation elongation factor Ts [Planctomycetes bacterium]|nr:translation elongation factor Ts [Planctomycetota bacterium]
MADISASMVKELRDRTGVGMMEAKKALVAAEGDTEAAIKALREAGVIKAGKKADRETTEGRICAATNGDSIVLVALACETDFVSRNDDFKALAQKFADSVAAAATVDNPEQIAFVDGGTLDDALKAAVLKIGENLKIASAKMIKGDGTLGAYVHHDGKSGAIVRLTGASSDATQGVATQVAIHIVASKPIALNRAAVDQKTIDEEREVYKKLVAAEGKPENIQDKIVEGKINAFFKDRVLVEQGFCLDAKQVIGDMVKAAGGGEVAAYEAIFI